MEKLLEVWCGSNQVTNNWLGATHKLKWYVSNVLLTITDS